MTQVLNSQTPRLQCNPIGRHNDGCVVVVEEKERRRWLWWRNRGDETEDQISSVLALVFEVCRKSLVVCKTEGGGDEEDLHSMEIGWPTDVRHVAHVTFDRFHGFLGLPVEFEPEVPRRAPSASTNVFGVSTKSMQCSYDSRGNSVPTILLEMQKHLYDQGGLKVEGIFRITAENSQEEYVREQLNKGVVPDGIDVHCLSGLIKAWFRELPSGVLDSLSSEQVMECKTEDDCIRIVKLLPPTESALLNWAVNLMADVVQEEEQNKMNARNVATVFAPNMTQMADPLTALMYAVQVMNFLRMLILKTIKERQESSISDVPIRSKDPLEDANQRSQFFGEPHSGDATEDESDTDEAVDSAETSYNNILPEEASTYSTDKFFYENKARTGSSTTFLEPVGKGSKAIHINTRRVKLARTNSQNSRKGRKGVSTPRSALRAEKSKEIGSQIV